MIVLLALVLVGCASSSGDSSAIVDYQETLDLIENEGAIIIDVRTPEEYADTHVAGALNIPLDTIDTQIGDYVDSLDQTMVLYCRSGNRSNQALNILVDLGYTSVYDLGAIGNWEGTFE